MSGFIIVSLAVCGGSLFLSAVLKRRFTEMLPLSLSALIALVFGFGLIGLLNAGVYLVVGSFLAAGAIGLYHTAEGRVPSAWTALPYLLSLAAVVYLTYGRIPQETEELTTWAYRAKAMFLTGDLAAFPALPILQHCILVWNAMLTGISDFPEWLLYTAYGMACVTMLLPLCRCSHPKKLVRAAYAGLFLISLIALLLRFFDLFSLLSPYGFLAIYAAYAVMLAAQPKTKHHALLLGAVLLSLTITHAAGLYFALAALAVYIFSVQENERLHPSAVIPVLFVIAGALASHYALSFSSIDFSGYASALTSQLTSVSVSLSGWLGSLLTLRVSAVFLAALLLAVSILLWHKTKSRAIVVTAVSAILFTLGLAFVYGTDSFDPLLAAGMVFWMLAVLGVAFSLGRSWNILTHIIALLVCTALILSAVSAVQTLLTDDFTETAAKQDTYYAIADEAAATLPEDATVYIVSQRDDGDSYAILRYRICPRPTNEGVTWWLSDPESQAGDYTYAISAADWLTVLADYDYVLIYDTDSYVTSLTACFADGTKINRRSLYSVNHETGLLEAVGE